MTDQHMHDDIGQIKIRTEEIFLYLNEALEHQILKK